VVCVRFIALFANCVLLVNCGGFYFVGFVSNPAGSTSVIGIVTAVNSGFVSAPTGLITPVTVVRFVNEDSAITVNFCGDQQQWFPVDKTVRAEYTAGILCSVLLNAKVNS
jgi:hypothetical protein